MAVIAEDIKQDSSHKDINGARNSQWADNLEKDSRILGPMMKRLKKEIENVWVTKDQYRCAQCSSAL